jgi:DNA-binding LacI/PurR family transcriptional regulator
MGTPAITALDRNPKVLAETACAILLKQIAQETDYEIENIILVSLVSRDSIR